MPARQAPSTGFRCDVIKLNFLGAGRLVASFFIFYLTAKSGLHRMCQFPLTQRGYVVEACTGCVSSPSHRGGMWWRPAQDVSVPPHTEGGAIWCRPRKRDSELFFLGIVHPERGGKGSQANEQTGIISLYFQVSHTEGGVGGGGGGVKGHLPTEENIMYLKKERSILLGAGPQIVSL